MKLAFSLLLLVCFPVMAQVMPSHRHPVPVRHVIAPNINLLDGLVSYWSLNEVSGSRADSEPTGVAQDLSESTPVSSDSGVISNAAVFSSGAYLYHDDSDDLSVNDSSFTVSLWSYATSLSGERGMVSKWEDPDGHEFYLRRYSGSYMFLVVTNGSSGFQVTQAITEDINEWHHFVVYADRENNVMGLSIDGGEPVTQEVGWGTPDATSAKWQIGTYALLSATFWPGRIDEVGFWKRALNADERAALYNGGIGLAYPFE